MSVVFLSGLDHEFRSWRGSSLAELSVFDNVVVDVSDVMLTHSTTC